MLKQTYIGMVDFHGAQWARIGGADLSKMTGVKGVKKLVLEKVSGLHGVLDLREIGSLVLKDTDMSQVHTILCNTNFNIEGLKKQKWNGLFIFDYVGPLNPNTKLIKDCIQNNNKQR